MADRAEGGSGGDEEAVRLQSALATLNELLLGRPDPETFLRGIVELAESVVPGTRCSIVVQPDVLDRVPRQRTVDRSREERDGASVTEQVADCLPLPLVVAGVTLGTLVLEPDHATSLGEVELERARAFARQAATTLALLRRESAHLALDAELQEAMVTRAVIDQAVGVLMHARRISGREALATLLRRSQLSNRKVSVLAAELVVEMTGHPPARPRPLTRRRPLARRTQDDEVAVTHGPRTTAPRLP